MADIKFIQRDLEAETALQAVFMVLERLLLPKDNPDSIRAIFDTLVAQTEPEILVTLAQFSELSADELTALPHEFKEMFLQMKQNEQWFEDGPEEGGNTMKKQL